MIPSLLSRHLIYLHYQNNPVQSNTELKFYLFLLVND